MEYKLYIETFEKFDADNNGEFNFVLYVCDCVIVYICVCVCVCNTQGLYAIVHYLLIQSEIVKDERRINHVDTNDNNLTLVTISSSFCCLKIKYIII